MAKKRHREEKAPNHERWLVSYGDFLTLLFAVFVVLYAMSQTDKRKVDELVNSLRESFGYAKIATSARKPSVLENFDIKAVPVLKPEIMTPGQGRRLPLPNKVKATQRDMKAAKQELEAQLAKAGATPRQVVIAAHERGLVISLREAGFFEPGSTLIKPSAVPLLTRIAESLMKYTNPLRIEGHTDAAPFAGKDIASNWELSTGRATTIIHFLVDEHFFDPATMSAVGYGQYRPEADNATAEGRARNRRVDIVLLSPKGAQQEPYANRPTSPLPISGVPPELRPPGAPLPPPPAPPAPAPAPPAAPAPH